jgi:hypothetical protein
VALRQMLEARPRKGTPFRLAEGGPITGRLLL